MTENGEEKLKGTKDVLGYSETEKKNVKIGCQESGSGEEMKEGREKGGRRGSIKERKMY